MSFYQIQIHFEPSFEIYNAITKLLNRTPLQPNTKEGLIPSSWTYNVVEQKEDGYFDFINQFVDILQPSFLNLEKLGIHRDDISIWLIYEYDGQCNMEFDPERLKRLADNGLSLCISCYDIHDYTKN